MPYKTGSWGEQEQKRNIRRRKYFRDRRRRLTGAKNLLGFEGEEEAKRLLGLKEKEMKGTGYDFFWKGKTLDVKTDTISSYRGTEAWQFSLIRQKGNVDYFLIICKDRRKKTQFIFLIPDKDIKRKFLWINPKKIYKFMKYIVKVR